MKIRYLTMTFVCFFLSCKQPPSGEQESKDFSSKLEDLVFEEKNSGTEFFLKILEKKGVLEYKITYLGNIKNSEGHNLDFLYSTVYTGNYEDSKRAGSIIVLYLDNKRYGAYQLGGGFNKNPTILENEMVIGYNDSDCDQITHINFKDSIPKEIFVHCKEENGQMFGDIFNFSEY
jgi:hypothetical protein